MPKTRRGILGAMAALAAGLSGRRAADAQVTQASCGNVVCYNRGTQTVNVTCKPGCVCCVFGNGNSRCMPPGSCTGTITCPICQNGQVCESGVCCSLSDGPCTGHDDCCGDGFCLGDRCVEVSPSTEPTSI